MRSCLPFFWIGLLLIGLSVNCAAAYGTYSIRGLQVDGEGAGDSVSPRPTTNDTEGLPDSVAPRPTTNETMAPSTSPNATNGTIWDGVITMGNETNNGTGSGNIFDQGGNNNDMEIDINGTIVNGSVAPRPVPVDGDINGTSINGSSATPFPSFADPNTTAPMPTPAPTPASCMVEADCGEGTFCSSIGICEELTCMNWANHTPAANASYSEEPCTAEGAQAGTAFCGWDGSCYEYGCMNWYNFGPVAFTGYNPGSPEELTCEEYENGAEENLNSATYGCRPWMPGKKAPEAKSWTHFFNQKCTAKPRGSDEFTCYDNLPSTDYRDFQGAVARLNPPSCDREVFGNEQPFYWYIIYLVQNRKGVETEYKEGRANTLSGASFNANLAEKTMFATLVSSDDAPDPTGIDGSSQPEENKSGAMSSRFELLAALLAVLASSSLLL